MRVLVVHNRYDGRRAGEDAVVEEESALLQNAGHEVVKYIRSNRELSDRGSRAGGFLESVWSTSAARGIRKVVDELRPDVVHVHNTWAVLSPSVLTVLRDVPVVHTLHNFRWLCASAGLHRKGRVCEKCVELAFPGWGVLYGCYRGSRVASTAVGLSSLLARKWSAFEAVDVFVALSEYAKERFVAAGISAERIAVKGNCLARVPDWSGGEEEFALYVGRLSEAKGLEVLLAAWSKVDVPLVIVGDGPMAERVLQAARANGRIVWCGWQEREQVHELLGRAAFLVVPSLGVEGMPMSIVEALGHGRAVIGASVPGIDEMLGDGEAGLLVPAGNPAALANAVTQLWENPMLRHRLGRTGRARFNARHSPEAGLKALMNVYARARSEAG